MFTKYPHIERLGNDEVSDILSGECWIFPKIDGTSASVWLEEGVLCAGSRRRQLSLEDDNAGFFKWLTESDAGREIESLLRHSFPWLTLYGEWLVPHSLKTYRKDAWRRFYVFDVLNRVTGKFVPYEQYTDILGTIDYIPVLEVCANPTEKHLVGLLNANTFLIQDGAGLGEGIVIKRYDFVNQYGRTTWAKLVRNEFKEANTKAFGYKKTEMGGLEIRLAEQFVTGGRVQKVFDKMTLDEPWSSKRIPELLGRVWNDLITEEIWGILKDHKNPAIDFRRFYGAVVQQIKAIKPKLF